MNDPRLPDGTLPEPESFDDGDYAEPQFPPGSYAEAPDDFGSQDDDTALHRAFDADEVTRQNPPVDPGAAFSEQVAYTPPGAAHDTAEHDRLNRGKARDRIARRRQKRGESVPQASRIPPPVRNAPPPAARVVRDPSSVVTRGITSARSAMAAGRGSVRGSAAAVPSFRLPISRTGLYLIGSAVFVIGVVIALGAARNRPVDSLPNALWIGTEWTYEARTDQEIFALTERLKRHEIGVVYAWVSWLQAENVWRGEANFENVQNFVTRFNEYYPQADLYGWVSYPVEIAPLGYRMNDAATHQIVADFSQRVIDDFGFDGVFLNIEPVWNDDENFLALLRRVRQTLGDDALISAAVPPDWSPIGTGIPVPPLIVPGTVWERDYKQSVALLVDQIAVMAYNSGLTAPADYTVWMAYQVSTFAETITDLDAGTEIVIGIPTYDAEPPGHDPAVENVITAVEGIRAGLSQSGESARAVRGIAIYAGWETDDIEWDDFYNTWVRANVR
ncbi:MAG: glycosyl hydrolase family 18 protein [bacterium]|nr:glycosyl hydrolase family 18 protein [bacterium]